MAILIKLPPIVGDGGKPRRRVRNGEGDNTVAASTTSGGTGGGWMTSDNNAPKKKLSMVNMNEHEASEAHSMAGVNKDKHFQEGDGEMLIIPDLDEDAGFDVDQRVAHAPKNVHRKIPTLAELEEELTASIPAQEEGLKLQVLSAALVPASLLYEADVPWTFESLLREVTEELSELPKPNPKPTPAGKPSPAQPSAAGKAQQPAAAKDGQVAGGKPSSNKKAN